MAVTEKLQVQTRSTRGKEAAKKMRREGLIPGVVYANGQPAKAVQVSDRDFAAVMRRHGDTALIELVGLPTGNTMAVYKHLQIHAVSRRPTHIDFQSVRPDEKITIRVNVKVEGVPVGVDKKGGTLVQTRNWVELSCFPNDIPESITVNVAHLDIGQALHLGEAGIPEKYTLVTPARTTLATCTASRETKKADEAATAEGAAAAPAAGAAGAAPAADAKAADGKAPAGKAPAGGKGK